MCLFFFLLSDDLSKQRLWSLWETAHPTQSLPSDQASSAQPDQSETGKDQSETGKDQSDDKAQSDDEKEAKVDETTESQPKEESDGRSPEPTESSPKPDSPVVNGYHDMEREEDGVPASSSSEDLFKKEPFVVAAAQFRRGMYVGVLDLLTEALSTGGRKKVHWTVFRSRHAIVASLVGDFRDSGEGRIY